MDTVLKFLAGNRICVLSVLLQNSASHSAVMHYSHSAKPFRLFFSTDRNSVKTSKLMGGESTTASVALGFDEGTMQTLQLRGRLRIASDSAEVRSIQKIHYAKLPEAAKYKDDPDAAFLVFEVQWWRFSDYKNDPPNVIES